MSHDEEHGYDPTQVTIGAARVTIEVTPLHRAKAELFVSLQAGGCSEPVAVLEAIEALIDAKRAEELDAVNHARPPTRAEFNAYMAALAWSCEVRGQAMTAAQLERRLQANLRAIVARKLDASQRWLAEYIDSPKMGAQQQDPKGRHESFTALASACRPDLGARASRQWLRRQLSGGGMRWERLAQLCTGLEVDVAELFEVKPC